MVYADADVPKTASVFRGHQPAFLPTERAAASLFETTKLWQWILCAGDAPYSPFTVLETAPCSLLSVVQQAACGLCKTEQYIRSVQLSNRSDRIHADLAKHKNSTPTAEYSINRDGMSHFKIREIQVHKKERKNRNPLCHSVFDTWVSLLYRNLFRFL